MDDHPRPGPSSEPDEASAQKAKGPGITPLLLISVVCPNVVDPLQVIPETRNEQIIQVALLSVLNGQFHIVRTGGLVIDPAKVAARDPMLPVPVVLPCGGSIPGVATVLPREMMQIILPNVSPRHQVMLRALKAEEFRILELRKTIYWLEREHSRSHVLMEWVASQRAVAPAVGERLWQAVEYEDLAAAFNLQHSHVPTPYARRQRRSRRLRAHQVAPVELPEPLISSPVEKCRQFLAHLRSLSLVRPAGLESAVRMLIQLLVDDVMTPELFCKRVERLLVARPQPQLVACLQSNMRGLRQALYLRLESLDGIERPERRVAFPRPVPTPELPECGPVLDMPGPVLPIAAIEPLQNFPLSAIPYDMPLPLTELHVSQVKELGLPALIKTELREGDLHLYSRHVGYIHFHVTPTAHSFQIGNTTVTLVQPRNPLCISTDRF